MLCVGRVSSKIVGLTCRNVGQIRRRVHVQDIQADLVKPVRGDLAEHTAVLETAAVITGGGRRARQAVGEVLDVRERIPVVVRALGEVALPFQRRRHPESHDVVAG